MTIHNANNNNNMAKITIRNTTMIQNDCNEQCITWITITIHNDNNNKEKGTMTMKNDNNNNEK